MGVAVQFVLSMLVVLWMDIHRGCSKVIVMTLTYG